MNKKNCDNLFEKLDYNNKQTIKYYNSLIRSERLMLILTYWIISVFGLSAVNAIFRYFNIEPETVITEELYETVKTYLLSLTAGNTLMAGTILFSTHKDRKACHQKIADLKLNKYFLEGKYKTCICNEAEDLSQKPNIGCEKVGNLTEAPQTLIRK
ncbi:MAG: hypothetical protein IJA94_03850 [Bacilli bacterium]|nr:hypothetical protein [Bacilli bacterium]